MQREVWQNWMVKAPPVRQAICVYQNTYDTSSRKAFYQFESHLLPHLAFPTRLLEPQQSADLFVEIIIPLRLIMVYDFPALRETLLSERLPHSRHCGQDVVLCPYSLLDWWEIPAVAVSYSDTSNWPGQGLFGYVL